MTAHLRLNLVFPPHLEGPITEALTVDSSMPGFTVLHAEGHTSDFGQASIVEQIRGRVERTLLWVLIPRERLPEVLNLIRTHCNSREVRWWTESVLDMGKLGP